MGPFKDKKSLSRGPYSKDHAYKVWTAGAPFWGNSLLQRFSNRTMNLTLRSTRYEVRDDENPHQDLLLQRTTYTLVCCLLRTSSLSSQSPPVTLRQSRLLSRSAEFKNTTLNPSLLAAICTCHHKNFLCSMEFESDLCTGLCGASLNMTIYVNTETCKALMHYHVFRNTCLPHKYTDGQNLQQSTCIGLSAAA